MVVAVVVKKQANKKENRLSHKPVLLLRLSAFFFSLEKERPKSERRY